MLLMWSRWLIVDGSPDDHQKGSGLSLRRALLT